MYNVSVFVGENGKKNQSHSKEKSKGGNPKKCWVCGNKLEVEGKDFTQLIKPNEYKAGESNYDYGLHSIQLNQTEHPDVIDWEE